MCADACVCKVRLVFELGNGLHDRGGAQGRKSRGGSVLDRGKCLVQSASLVTW